MCQILIEPKLSSFNFPFGFADSNFSKVEDTLLSSLISPTQLSDFHCSEEETVTSPLPSKGSVQESEADYASFIRASA